MSGPELALGLPPAFFAGALAWQASAGGRPGAEEGSRTAPAWIGSKRAFV